MPPLDTTVMPSGAQDMFTVLTGDKSTATALAAHPDVRMVSFTGGTVGGNITNSGPGDFAATFALNAGHAAELIRIALPHLRSAGGGAVVIISSITGLRPAPRTTTTNVAASSAARSTQSASAAASARSSAFNTAGRLSVIQLTPSRAS